MKMGLGLWWISVRLKYFVNLLIVKFFLNYNNYKRKAYFYFRFNNHKKNTYGILHGITDGNSCPSGVADVAHHLRLQHLIVGL